MRVIRVMLVAIVTCSAVLFVASTFGQGSLTPPGAPAPTMKTLTQIEPRTPISSAGYTITNSGSYYLTTNLTTTSHGIIIRSDHVTLDLMGFSLTGDRGSSDYGVWMDGAINAAVSDVVVRNGAIHGFGSGVFCDYGNNSRFKHLLVSSNYSYGVWLNGSDGGRCNGNTVADCTISSNDFYGIRLSGYSGQCNGNTVRDCTIIGNGSYGVFLYGWDGQCDGNTVRDCAIIDNGSYGVYLLGMDGQCAGNIVADCTVRKNTNYGIHLDYTAGNRVEGNHVTGQTGTPSYGIWTANSSQNMIFHNTCVGQTTNFSISVSDTYGPIVTTSGALSGTDPWANFSR